MKARRKKRTSTWTAASAIQRWARFYAHKTLARQRGVLRHLAINVPDAFNALPPEVRHIAFSLPRPVDSERIMDVLKRGDLDERQRAILTARASGTPLEEIARRLGITRQRVHQIESALLAG